MVSLEWWQPGPGKLVYFEPESGCNNIVRLCRRLAKRHDTAMPVNTTTGAHLPCVDWLVSQLRGIYSGESKRARSLWV